MTKIGPKIANFALIFGLFGVFVGGDLKMQPSGSDF